MTLLKNTYYTTTFRMRAGQTGWLESGSGKFATMHEDDVIATFEKTQNGNLASVEVTVAFPLDRERFENGNLSEEDERAMTLARAMVLDRFPGTFFFQKPSGT